MLDYARIDVMGTQGKSLEAQMAKWEGTRSKGRTRYVVMSWVIPYGLVMPAFMSLIAFPFILRAGHGIKAIGVFSGVFGPIFLAATALAGRYSWSYFEKRYERWEKEKSGDLINVPGTRKPLHKYTWLLVAIYSIPFFLGNLLYFLSIVILAVVAEDFADKYIDTNIFFSSFGLIFLVSIAFLLNGMIFVKNPICGHGMLSNPQDHQHPDAKGNYLKNAWKIVRGKPFICLDCADRYVLEKNNDQVEIVKLDNGQY